VRRRFEARQEIKGAAVKNLLLASVGVAGLLWSFYMQARPDIRACIRGGNWKKRNLKEASEPAEGEQ